MSRLADIVRFYDLLQKLEEKVGGKRQLAACHGRMGWPARGVYFFFEPEEQRAHGGSGPRVVRVGTHALKVGARTSLWRRLAQHKGVGGSGGGNHRGSIFRLLVGEALKSYDGYPDVRSWGRRGDVRSAAQELGLSPEDLQALEHPLETGVSRHIGSMPFLWIEVDDAPGPGSDRGLIERNSIALLSNFGREAIDPPSPAWLGRHCGRDRVRRSGLWNNNHVEERHDRAFLSALEQYVEKARSWSGQG